MNDVELLAQAILNLNSNNKKVDYLVNEKINLNIGEKHNFNKTLKDYKIIFLIIGFSENNLTPSEKTKTTVCVINDNSQYLSSSFNQMYLNKSFTKNYIARFSLDFNKNTFEYNGYFENDTSSITKEGRIFIEKCVGIS